MQDSIKSDLTSPVPTKGLLSATPGSGVIWASSVCPICGKDQPHAHDTDALIAWLRAQASTYMPGTELVIRAKADENQELFRLRNRVQSLEDDIREAGYRERAESFDAARSVPDTAPMYVALREARLALIAVNSGASMRAIRLIDGVLNAAPEAA